MPGSSTSPPARASPTTSRPSATRCGSRATTCSSRSSWLGSPGLAEARRAPLEERAPALLGLLGAVVEGERAERDLVHPGDVLGVGVEGLLGELDRRRALLEDLPTPALGLRPQLGRRHDRVDEPHGQRLLGAVAAAEVPHLPRLFLADHAGEIGGAEAGV